jgi:uncharacterized membrane protein
LAFTGFLLPVSGWFSSRESARPSSRTETRIHARAHDLSSEAAWRHRTGQTTHWRPLVMHR